jgi:hypothetical protein
MLALFGAAEKILAVKVTQSTCFVFDLALLPSFVDAPSNSALIEVDFLQTNMP